MCDRCRRSDAERVLRCLQQRRRRSSSSGSGPTASGTQGDPVTGRHTHVRAFPRRRCRPQPDQRSVERLDLHDPADLRPARRGQRLRARARAREVVGHLLRRQDLDLPSARCEVLERRPGHRRGRQVLDRALRRSEDQHQLRDPWCLDRLGRRRRRPHRPGQSQPRRRRLPRQHRDVRRGDRPEEGRRGHGRQGVRRRSGRLRPVHGQGLQARPAHDPGPQPELLARGPAVSRRDRLRVRAGFEHPHARAALG